MRGTRRALVAVASLVLASVACGSSTGGTAGRSALGDGAITVASFNFPESEVLAELYAQVLEGHGFRVDLQLGLGPRELVDPALQRGLVELVPEYAGSAAEFFGGTSSSDPVATHTQLVASLASRGLTALSASPAQDRNVFVVTTATANRLQLRTVSDLRQYASGLAFGGPPECPARLLCLLGLRRTYGLTFQAFEPLDAGGPLTQRALLDGDVTVGLLFSSDPQLDTGEFLALRDDRHLQPAENVTPVIVRETLDRFGPRLGDALDGLSAVLRTSDLRAMNASLAAGRSPFAVARAWLSSRGFTVPSG